MEPRFVVHQLIEVLAYDGKVRAEVGEVSKVSWSSAFDCWRYLVRCFTAEGEKAKFRNFLETKLEAI